MNEPERGTNIGCAGNTYLPALLALRAKGYRIRIDYTLEQTPNDEHPEYHGHWQAERDNAFFYGSNPLDLLGLIAMWEVRGNDWQTKPEERVFWEELVANSRTFDREGNEIIEADGQ